VGLIDIVTWGVRLAGVYALAGLAFAVFFVARGAGRMDPAARDGTWGFRLIILPGVAALWPLLAWRWLRGGTEPPVECTAHRRAAGRAP
jgi:hypothetical protein